MLEIIVANSKERFFLQGDDKTSVKRIKTMIAKLSDISMDSNLILMDIENLAVLDDGLLIKDAVSYDSSRLLLLNIDE